MKDHNSCQAEQTRTTHTYIYHIAHWYMCKSALSQRRNRVIYCSANFWCGQGAKPFHSIPIQVKVVTFLWPAPRPLPRHRTSSDPPDRRTQTVAHFLLISVKCCPRNTNYLQMTRHLSKMLPGWSSQMPENYAVSTWDGRKCGRQQMTPTSECPTFCRNTHRSKKKSF